MTYIKDNLRAPLSRRHIACVILCVSIMVGCDSNGSNSDGSSDEPPDVTLTITGPAEIAARTAFQFELVVNNTGGDAREFNLTTTFPNGIQDPAASGGATIESSVATWPTVDVLPAGETRTFTISMVAARAGEMFSRAEAEWIDKPGATMNYDAELKTVVGFDTLYTIESSGGAATASFGEYLIDVADVGGDGIRDFAIAEQFTSLPWIVTVFAGMNGTEISSFSSSNVIMFDLENVGDVDGDGMDDLAVGTPDIMTPGTAEVQIYAANSGSHIMTIREPEGGPDFAYRLAAAGDVNGDGFDDIYVTDPSYFVQDVAHGRLYLYSGLDGSQIWSVNGPFNPEPIGSAVTSFGDLDGDLISDVAVSSGPHIYIHSGVDGSLLMADITVPGANELIHGMTSAGDVSGDGVPDLYVGDTQQDGRGAAYVLSGVDGSVIMSAFGENSNDFFGDGHTAGDLDGDGRPDFVVTAWNSDAGADNGGKVSLISGSTGATIYSYIGREAGGGFGLEAIAIEDVNNDGLTDYLVSTGTNRVLAIAAVPE